MYFSNGHEIFFWGGGGLENNFYNFIIKYFQGTFQLT